MSNSTIKDFFEIESLREDYDMELKLAVGKEGSGSLPRNFWETYSAMANTEGGMILLGVAENKEKCEFVNIKNPGKLKKDIWNGLNNPQKVSVNILHNDDVFEVKAPEDKTLLAIKIPRASRKQRPVYINGNPLTGTYRRNNDGDYRCPDNVVKQMLGDQEKDTNDSAIIEEFGINDLNIDTLKIYRQNFANLKPVHPFNDYDNNEFLRQIGAYSQDRQTGKEGLTAAGLLMFGKLRAILDVFPNYIVDYQERPRAITENRWIDRIYTDFSWSGNLYDFYRLVINKLYANLKVPFALKGDQRIDDTPVHEALREAFVNTLIHADYKGNCSILIVKRPDLFGFRNPGTLRLPKEEILRGGISDCRNRNLQMMFRMVNLGEQAGSGVPKIMKNWELYKWRQPELEERLESDQTLLVLKTVSLLPEDAVEVLHKSYGQAFDELPNIEKLAMTTAKVDGCVTHKRLMDMSKEHPHDLTLALHGLVEKKMLCSEGAGRATFYYLPGQHPIQSAEERDIFLHDNTIKPFISQATLSDKAVKSVHYDKKSVHYDKKSVHCEADSVHFRIKNIALPIAGKGRVSAELMRQTILNICAVSELSIKELSELLMRSEQTIRINYINSLCEEGVLVRKFPNIIHHPKQKYRTVEKKAVK